jgi:transcriptional regulator with XRE-family HTH domain
MTSTPPKPPVPNRELIAEAVSRALGRYKTQDDLAEELGVSQQTISKWINGKAIPGTRSVQSLCRELNKPRFTPVKLRPDLFADWPADRT